MDCFSFAVVVVFFVIVNDLVSLNRFSFFRAHCFIKSNSIEWTRIHFEEHHFYLHVNSHCSAHFLNVKMRFHSTFIFYLILILISNLCVVWLLFLLHKQWCVIAHIFKSFFWDDLKPILHQLNLGDSDSKKFQMKENHFPSSMSY